MGMFDTVHLKIKCPYCGQTSLMDAQTKDLDCELKDYHEGDKVYTNGDYLDCIAECTQDECQEYANKKLNHNVWSVLGRFFRLKAFIHNNKIVGMYEITRTDENLYDD